MGMLLAGLMATPGHAVEASAEAFDIWEYQVEGNTLLPATAVEKAVYPYLGPARGVEAVEGARTALQAAYRDAGYSTVLVELPEQPVGSGIVTLRVVQSTVSKLRVVGARYTSPGRIAATLASAAPGTTPNFNQFQKDIETVNRFPGSRVTPVLRPGRTPGTTEVDLNVVDKNPLTGSVELNNDHGPNTTATRLTVGASYANLWQAGHNFSLQYQTAPEQPDESKVWVASYVFPLQHSDNMVALYAVSSRANVATVSDFSVIGDGEIYGARLVMPLSAQSGLYHSLTLGIDDKNFRENVAQPGTPGTQTPLHYWPASISYAGGLNAGEVDWQFSTGLVAGLRGWGDDELAYDNKRYKARGNFIVWKWDVKRTQSLNKWLTLSARIDGQVADQPLVSNEQMSAGGASSVRGYLQSEVVGDNGVHMSFELGGPSLIRGPDTAYLRPLVFIEGSYLWNENPLPGNPRDFSLYSAGLGLRVGQWHRLDASLDVGWPLKSTTNTPSGSARAQFSATLKF
jgi:hemolysin activation/secretion protein